jgi:Glycoside hydrolase family 44
MVHALVLLLGSAVAASAPTLSVDVNSDRHPISDNIYGMNFCAEDLAKELALPVNRWGGNATSRYNWQVNVSNAGSDYYFIIQNLGSPPTPSADADAFVAQNVRTGTRSILTIPVIPYLTRGRPGVTTGVTAACSYSVPTPYSGTQFDTTLGYGGSTCGNGSKAGVPVGLLSSTQRDALNVANTQASAQGWIAHLVATYGAAAAGGVALYMMDNEPSLWQSTHPDIYAVNQLSYDVLVSQTELYARAVKDSDATAQVMGPSDWGYSAYFDSPPGYALGTGGYAAHSNTFFGIYYLQQMQAYAAANSGLRILDYFDEHYYPQAVGANGNQIALHDDDGAPATQALRLRAVRSLWDSTYTDESWIASVGAPFPTQLQLIPRFRGWVASNYPGTKVSLSEYNFGALNSMNGALTQADVLGVFGREQLDLATLWGPPAATDPGAYAFRIYRNYDGAGSRYGDVWVQAESSDQSQLALYAAQRSADGALTLVVLNKTAASLASPITVANFPPAAAVQGFQYSASNLGSIQTLPETSLSAGVLSASYPSNSITLWVVAGGGAAATDGGAPDAGGSGLDAGSNGSSDGGGTGGGDGSGGGPGGVTSSVVGSCSTAAGGPGLCCLALALLLGLTRLRSERG